MRDRSDLLRAAGAEPESRPESERENESAQKRTGRSRAT